jgi:hypothetical protein
MFSEKADLRGKSGVKRLEQVGDYVIIANRLLDDAGRARRFAVVNETRAWVDSVHSSPSRALAVARELTIH